ncbi:MAG: MBL fold metallo-hydrolase [Firmicutes bacterium]|nr:MBL fold metallo-hydrolase [Bacillota bacterium]
MGCYGPYPAAGQNCSGYLVEDEAAVVLLDCGSGVLSRLRHFVEPWELNAVILTHLHSDHMADVLIIRYALLIKRLQEAGLPLLVYAPAQPKEEFSRLAYKNVVQSKPLSSNTTLTIGTMRFTFTPAVHAITAYMITVESGGKKLVYSGDTEYFPRMHGFFHRELGLFYYAKSVGSRAGSRRF